jgi:hypothetical protein
MSEYAGRQFVGIDLHRRRSVIVRTTDSGEVLESVRILNDVESLERVIERAGEDGVLAAHRDRERATRVSRAADPRTPAVSATTAAPTTSPACVVAAAASTVRPTRSTGSGP